MGRPTTTHGFVGKVKQLVKEMERQRTDKEKPRNVTLRQHLREKYDGLEPGHLYEELGVQPEYMTVQQLMGDDDMAWLMPEIVRDGVYRGMGLAQREQLNAVRDFMASLAPVTSEAGAGGNRWLSPEIFTDPVMRGAVQATFYPDLVVREITVGNLTVTVPFLDLSRAVLKESHEGATIEEGSVNYADKKVTIRKRARGIKVTYEAVEFNTLDLVQLYFEDFGRLLGHTLNGDAVLALINGDQEDGSEAAAVVGVADTDDGITYKDVLRVWARLSMLGRSSTSIIGNETSAIDYLTLPEVLKKDQVGSQVAPTTIKTPLPTQQDLYLSPKVPGEKLVFSDSSASLVQLTARPLMVESERIASKQLAGTYASIYTGFSKLNRNASVVLDGNVTIDAAPFPDWMQNFEDED